jgi:YHYH protein
MKSPVALFILLSQVTAIANPQLTSWFTTNSGQYARIYATTAAETAGTKSATWSRGMGTQTQPVYADINEIKYSANWVYIRTSGLASHVMGPWYLNAAKTNLFPNYPSNTAVVYRIPRTPVISVTKSLTGLGATGRMVNGVSMFDSRDAFSYSNGNAADATPGSSFTGDGIWNRDGYHNEGVTFDPALAHQAGNNYHYHAQPIGLRHQLGDHVNYNSTTNRYTESSAPVTTHSPILAWAADGLPVYGPYGYSSPLNASSGVRRMVSGFALRNGTNGTTAITVRQVLPLWAQRVQNKITLATTQYGPAVNATYLLGHYIEDFDYRGDLGQTHGVDFDLNEQNVRYCVTPEFPSGTWAYFTPINSDNAPAFPYTTGRQFYGSPTGGGTNAATMNADTPLTQHFLGGANTPVAVKSAEVSSGTVTITWSAVEGGTYSVDASPDQTAWTNKAIGQVATGTSKSAAYATLATSGTEYGRVNRTALATYDTNGQTAATVAQSTVTSYLAGTPLTGIQNWRQTWYNSPDNSGNAADHADPYQTGVNNLAVYAFFGPGQNPATAKVSDLPQAQLSADRFIFDFTEPPNVSGIIYAAQSNATLLDPWQSVADTGSGTRHIFSVPMAGNPRMFLRLKVTSP